MNAATNPTYRATLEQALPHELLELAQYVAWKPEKRKASDLKPTKVPYSPRSGRRAASDDSKTWGTLSEALCCVEEGHAYVGVGFMFHHDFTGIDLDGCRNPETGAIEPWAMEIVKRLNSYTEVSPSGTGLHIILRGNVPDGGNRTPWHSGIVEMYDHTRFFTMTGAHLVGAPPEITDRQDELTALHTELFAGRKPKAQKVERVKPNLDLSDEQLLLKARNARVTGPDFSALHDAGDTSAYNDDESRADWALCRHLAFWTGGDPSRIDRLFRASHLMRDKWDERRGATTYGELTIWRAIEATPNFYDPGKTSGSGALQSGQHGPQDVPLDESTAHESANSEENERTSDSSQGDTSLNSPFAPSQRKPPAGMKAEAYYGLAGDIVRDIDPHTEADPDGVLIQVLTIFGAIAGRKTHFRASADRHYPNLFVVLVGETAAARKGMSWGAARHVFTLISEMDDWLHEHTLGGMSSGEGLIHAVRDYKPKEDDESGRRAQPEPLQLDKRVIVYESEFSSVLKMPSRDGNTLSEVQRRAWDGVVLQTLTKNAPERASGAHIAIVGNITREELSRYLSQTETANGFGNRYLWVHVQMSKLLPDGGDLDSVNWQPLVARLRNSLKFVGKLPKHHVMTRDTEARDLWHKEYPRLTAANPGLFGAMTARGASQVMRLATIYALLDCSKVIREPHLRAALALWDYVEDSVRYIFGDALGDPIADAILRKLRATSEGVTRTDISSLFARHAKAAEIDRGLTLLQERNLARCEKEQPEGGRPAERWFSTMLTADANRRNAKVAKKAPPPPMEEVISPISQFATSQQSADGNERLVPDVKEKGAIPGSNGHGSASAYFDTGGPRRDEDCPQCGAHLWGLQNGYPTCRKCGTPWQGVQHG